MSIKDGEDHGHHGHHGKNKMFRRVFIFVAGFILLVVFAILIIWLVLRPAKPKFYLQDAAVTTFNISGGAAAMLTVTLQITLSTRNPNDRVGVYYDKLDAFAAYRSQQITFPTAIPPTYQGHHDVVVWSPFLYGMNVPIAPYVSTSLDQDKSSGLLLLNVKVNGRLRWKVGSWTSGGYHIFVDCPAVLTFNGGHSPTIRFQQISTCSVDV
ncbi:unnamed protein product [Spirodela intermedia]|uniref:Late embryogenesis abundant protein LEA-2 subgroup domain-containing protein n=1 Tax=Spirodela intermedia TaxID=51605 RepID=A0A7I8IRW8_SPIIN|nr:unnamed protein product [Spirodela intermedia]CAA6660494.1 unnamed protein product [Spirodela intermedia]